MSVINQNEPTQMNQVGIFCEKYNIDESGQLELIELFNQCMVHVATGIMNLPGVKETKVGKKTKEPKEKVVRERCIGETKTGKACRKYKIGDTDYCKLHGPKEGNSAESSSDSERKEDSASCNAICKNKEKCKQKGRMMKPDGAEFEYCFKHTKKWELYEGVGAQVKETEVELDCEFKNIVLSDDQEDERLQNNLTKEEFIKADQDFKAREKMAEDKLSPEEMEKWKKENSFVVESNETIDKIEPKVVENVKETRTKKPKRPNSWVSKQKEKLAKEKVAREKREAEMRAEFENDE